MNPLKMSPLRWLARARSISGNENDRISADPPSPAMDGNLLPNLPAHEFGAEQIKSLRTKVLFPEKGVRPRAIAVTSPGMGEGKSFVAANLAIAIAMNLDGERVMLIDCDMRTPSLHRMFGYPGDRPGLSDYLSGNADLSEFLLKPDVTPDGGLSLLPGGRPIASPSEYLSSRKMIQLLKEARTRYQDRYLLLDLPPPRIVAETRVLAMESDAVIIVVQYGRTKKEHIRHLLEILDNANVTGFVMNHFDVFMHPSTQKVFRSYINRQQA